MIIKPLLYKKTVVSAVAALIILAAASVFLWRLFSFKTVLPRTAQGILLEELLPSDISFAASFNPSDDAQRQYAEKLWGKIFQDKKDAVIPYLAAQLFTGPRNLEVIVKGMKAIGETPRILIALQAGSQAVSQREMFAIASVDNPLALRDLLKQDAGKNFTGRVLIDDAEVFLLALGSGSAYCGIAGDAFFTAALRENAEAIIQRYKNRGKGSFAKTVAFKKTFPSLKPPFAGYVFIDAEKGGIMALPAQNALGAGGVSLLTLRSAEAGLHLDLFTSSGSSPKPYIASLFKKMPGRTFLFFFESHGMDAVFAGDRKAEFEEMTGFDFASELQPFLSQGFAAAMHNADDILPVITFLIDASAAPDKAAAALQKLNERVPAWMALISSALKEKAVGEPVAEYKKIGFLQQGAEILFYCSRIPQTVANIPMCRLLKNPLKISYGIAPGNLIVISTMPDLEKFLAEKETAGDSPLFQEAADLGIAPGGIVLIDGSAIGDYTQKFIDALKAGGEKLDNKEEEAIGLLQKYLSPLKSFVQISQSNGKNTVGKAFLRVR